MLELLTYFYYLFFFCRVCRALNSTDIPLTWCSSLLLGKKIRLTRKLWLRKDWRKNYWDTHSLFFPSCVLRFLVLQFVVIPLTWCSSLLLGKKIRVGTQALKKIRELPRHIFIILSYSSDLLFWCLSSYRYAADMLLNYFTYKEDQDWHTSISKQGDSWFASSESGLTVFILMLSSSGSLWHAVLRVSFCGCLLWCCHSVMDAWPTIESQCNFYFIFSWA